MNLRRMLSCTFLALGLAGCASEHERPQSVPQPANQTENYSRLGDFGDPWKKKLEIPQRANIHTALKSENPCDVELSKLNKTDMLIEPVTHVRAHIGEYSWQIAIGGLKGAPFVTLGKVYFHETPQNFIDATNVIARQGSNPMHSTMVAIELKGQKAGKINIFQHENGECRQLGALPGIGQNNLAQASLDTPLK